MNPAEAKRLRRIVIVLVSISAFAIAMGGGRSGYTPLLPAMQRAAHFGATIAWDSSESAISDISPVRSSRRHFGDYESEAFLVLAGERAHHRGDGAEH